MDLGIKETREAVEGGLELLIAIFEELSDGIQVTDAIAIFSKLQSNAKLRDALVKAAKDIHKAPAEIKDLDMDEAIALSMVLLPYIPKMIAALSNGKKN